MVTVWLQSIGSLMSPACENMALGHRSLAGEFLCVDSNPEVKNSLFLSALQTCGAGLLFLHFSEKVGGVGSVAAIPILGRGCK
jgi:hypothetical protein